MFKTEELSYKIYNKSTGEFFQSYMLRNDSYTFTEIGTSIKKYSTIMKHIRGMERIGIDISVLEIIEFELVRKEVVCSAHHLMNQKKFF